MRNKVFHFFIFLVLATSATAQPDDFKKAEKAFLTYKLEPTINKQQLFEAVAAIGRVTVPTDDPSKACDIFLLRGGIYAEVATQIITIRQLGFGNESELPQVENPALDAFLAYQQAYPLSQKVFQKNDALKELQNVQDLLYNIAIYKYEDGNYQAAYLNFKASLDAHSLLKQAGIQSKLDAPDEYDNHVYLTGLMAMNANLLREARANFQPLVDKGYDKVEIYEAMYKIVSAEEGPEAAYRYLEQGREKYPESSSLLFAEINHALATNRVDASLIRSLEKAISNEPDNTSLYSTMGQVYATLNQQEPSQAYFDKAVSYYGEALKRDANSFDANYSLGGLYYNRAAIMAQQGTADINLILDEFNQALPYFQRCEALNPNDFGTLTALKEIYAGQGNAEMSEEFSRRWQTVQEGGQVRGSFFKR